MPLAHLTAHSLVRSCALGSLLASVAHAESAGWIDDPEALRQSIPALKEQRFWADFATPEEQRLFDGPETVYPEVPKTSFDLSGFDAAMLGSPVPAVGVHPRVLFSPQDAPMLKARIDGSKLGAKARAETRYVLSRTLFDPTSSEGRIFAKLVANDVADLKWQMQPDANAAPFHWFAGYEQTLGTSVHTPYLPNLFAAAAFQCWLDNNQEHGRQVATAIANYCAMRDVVLTSYIADSTRLHRAPDTYWRAVMIVSGGNNIAFAYDLAASWMDERQKSTVRQLISHTTAGRLAYGMNGPARWAETNWSSWDLELYLTATAIEGEEGADPRIALAARRCLSGFLQWGINENGTIFESNGKNGSGFHWAVLTMTAMARRGDNWFGHPHFRKHPVSQAQTIVPAGGLSLNNGTWGNSMPFCASFYLAFFPKDPVSAFLQRQVHPELATMTMPRGELTASERAALNLKKATLLTPAHSLGATPFTCIDWPSDAAEQRSALRLSPDVIDPIHGLMQTRSGDDAEALHLMFEARPDLSTVGHEHHDAGHFYLSALGEQWAVESGAKSFNSVDHNVVRIDGLGLADVAYPPKVRFLGGVATANGAMASADITNAYCYGWTNPTQFQWTIPAAKTWKISVETDPDVVAFFRGTQHYPMRIWGTDHWHQNWGPTMRIASANPVKSAFRSAGLVRGKHPYAVVVDDIDKGDGTAHLYEWTMQVSPNTRLAQLTMPKDNTAAAVLVKGASSDDWRAIDTPSPPPKGTPALLIGFLDRMPEVTDASMGNTVNNAPQPFALVTTPYAGIHPGQFITRSRFHATCKGTTAKFRMVLIPFRIGDTLPTITWNDQAKRSIITWANQQDDIAFHTDGDRTRVTVSRAGTDILAAP